MKLTIVIPAHNEEASLPFTLARLSEGVRVAYEIVIVDDHSTDSTSKVVTQLSKQYPNLRLVKNDDTPPGFTNAIKKGFSQVREGAVVLVMADNCDEPDTINSMYEKILEGYDVVCGSRYAKSGKKIGGRFLQTIFSRWAGKSLHFLIGLPTRDASNAFKMYKKQVLDSIDIEEAGFASSLEIVVKLYQKGYRITEIPTTWHDRMAGKSNFRIFKVLRNYLRWYVWAILVRKR
jgi:dolichol-phosphate mannosyltransferase